MKGRICIITNNMQQCQQEKWLCWNTHTPKAVSFWKAQLLVPNKESGNEALCNIVHITAERMLKSLPFSRNLWSPHARLSQSSETADILIQPGDFRQLTILILTMCHVTLPQVSTDIQTLPRMSCLNFGKLFTGALKNWEWNISCSRRKPLGESSLKISSHDNTIALVSMLAYLFGRYTFYFLNIAWVFLSFLKKKSCQCSFKGLHGSEVWKWNSDAFTSRSMALFWPGSILTAHS